MLANFWKYKKVLITGNTGFKGSWLSIWLSQLGANIKGYSLPPPASFPSLFQLSGICNNMQTQFSDVRDIDALKSFVHSFDPEIIFHFAAQPLVRASYKNPTETYDINIMGTVNVLEVARASKNLRVLLNVTSDKCYQNNEENLPFNENDPMGGYDPYSSSKGCSELITNAYRSSYFMNSKQEIALSSVRAGNVIGGGDWSLDRIVPDFFRALESKKPLKIRNPNSVRPWQHVLEPLSGYISLAEKMYLDHIKYSQAWNFGPEQKDILSVIDLVKYLAKQWSDIKIALPDETISLMHEAKFLQLDINKAKTKLSWYPKWTAKDAVSLINDFYNTYYNKQNILDLCLRQIDTYTKK